MQSTGLDQYPLVDLFPTSQENRTFTVKKLSGTELKGRYKTVIPLSGDCKSACH